MSSKQRTLLFGAMVIAALAGVVGWYVLGRPSTGDITGTNKPMADTDSSVQGAFERDGLKTDTTLTSIDLSLVLDGGPGKDGIPAIDEPKFISVSDARDELRNASRGLVVTVGETTRFYPYAVMNWHEVVNDTIEDKALTVSFCPLCGSAIVFDPLIGGQVLRFGVSGKLYESNLLMYDRTTESLWSQSRGEAVVGALLGTKLEIYPSQVLSFEQFGEQYPDGQVLSQDTGYSRRYETDPYSGYGDTDATFFPVSVRDERFPAKEIFFVVNVGDKSVAFKLLDLTQDVTATIDVDGVTLTAVSNKGAIEVTAPGQTKPIPGYHEMWFSWATHHQEDGVVWKKN